ncbi:hypothetical protein D3C87_857440 [compost metagenome]
MPNSMIQKDAREGKGSKQALEKKWDRAKGAAGTEGGEQNWALTNYIYQKMTASPDLVLRATALRVAAHFALQAGDLNTSQGDDPECNEPGPGGAPDLYEYQDEENTPGVTEFDGPDCAANPHEAYGDDVVYASADGQIFNGFAAYNTRVLAALGVDSTIEPPSIGTGSSPVEFQDSVEIDPGMGPAATPVPDEPVGVPEEVYSEPELPTGVQPKKPVAPKTPTEPVQPTQPKQAASTQTMATQAQAARVLQTIQEVNAEKWSSDVKTQWHPPEGFFEGSAEKIAKGLKRESNGLAQAMSRLNFYINRAGSNLGAGDKQRLEHAKDVLHDLYGD